MEAEIKAAVELLNKNEYIVLKVNKAQLAIAQNCKHDYNRCNFNLLGIKCVDLLCVQDEIRKQILPYIQENEETEKNDN